MLLVTSLGTTYVKRKKYFEGNQKRLEQLDRPYLLAEVMMPPDLYEDQIYQQMLRRSNKSMIETVHQLEDSKKEYEDYIEQWIHEVKTPITTMNLICENEKNETTRKLQSELSKVDHYVEMALYYARSGHVYQDYLIQKVNLGKVVADTIAKDKQYYIINRISIVVNCEEGEVSCDEKWLSFILKQILLNAVKYRRDTGAKIVIFTKRFDHGVQLMITDNGTGIKEEELGRIFQKGFTGTNGRNNVESTGMGLYLCEKLSRKLGLGLQVESKEGRYTKMILTFPVGTYLSNL